jgi:uncharacterized protein (DUF1697 family)
MTAVVALLRAVNIGGRWIKMAELTALFHELGFADARTYVQSGNVVFTAGKANLGALKGKIEKAIAARFGFHSHTILRTGEQLHALIAANPFPAMAKKDPARLVVHFAESALTAADKTALAMEWAGPEEWRAIGDDVYITYPDGQGRSKLALKLKTPGTRRNFKSVLALAAMADAMNSQAGGATLKSRPQESSAQGLKNGGEAMAKGQQRPSKEKRKPKADKNKPKKGAPLPSLSGQPSGATPPMPPAWGTKKP